MLASLDIRLWLLAGVCAAIAGFWLLLFGSRRRNPPVMLRTIDDFAAALPSIAGITRGSICEGNVVEILQDGDGFFPALLRDIGEARHSIHLETYVWGGGEIARRVGEALAARARDGIEVRVLVDALGAHTRDRDLFAAMQKAGCQVAVYCPLWPQNIRRWNHRSHRKLFIADGRVGMVFGQGIDEKWSGHAQDRNHYRDTALRVVGPAVHALQSVFTENWIEETGELTLGDEYFPPAEQAGKARAHVVSSSSTDAVSSVALVYGIAIASARREVIIQNPYFVPRWDVVELMIYPLGCFAFFVYGFAIGWGNWFNGPVAPGWYASLGPGTAVLNGGWGLGAATDASGNPTGAFTYGLIGLKGFFLNGAVNDVGVMVLFFFMPRAIAFGYTSHSAVNGSPTSWARNGPVLEAEFCHRRWSSRD